MKILYIKLDDKNKVVRVDTNKIDGYIRIEVEDGINFDMMLSCFYADDRLVFNEQHYQNRIAKRKAKADALNQKKQAQNTLHNIEMKHRLAALTDDEALTVMSLFPHWNKKNEYNKNERIVYQDNLYKVLENTNGEHTPPNESPSLYSVL